MKKVNFILACVGLGVAAAAFVVSLLSLIHREDGR